MEMGSHWIGLWIKNKLEANFFDSLGQPPDGLIKEYLVKN
jgi:hypothetical protein